MPNYRVREGAVLPCNGTVHEAGAIIALSREVASDMAVAALVEEVDAAGQPVPPKPADDLARFKAHERVGILHERLAAAEAVVASLKAQIEAEEQVLVDAVAVVAKSRGRRAEPPAAAKGAE